MSTTTGPSIREVLSHGRTRAMKQRDRAALAVYRTALAAIDNAEAVDAASATAPGAEPVLGAGGAEVERRHLSEAGMRAIVAHEAEERRVAATDLAQAQPQVASRLLDEAALLERLLAETSLSPPGS